MLLSSSTVFSAPPHLFCSPRLRLAFALPIDLQPRLGHNRVWWHETIQTHVPMPMSRRENRRIFQRYLETRLFGRRASIITAADHSTKSVPFLLPFPISILAVLAPNWIARFFSLAAPCNPSSSASSLKSFFAGSMSCAAPSGELSRNPHFCQTFKPRV